MHYSYLDSPVGKLLLTGEDTALTGILFEKQGRPVPPEPEWDEQARPFDEVKRQLDAYFAGRLRDFDLELAPGRWVALVGASGSGKSTVGKLLCGLLEPWSGEILIDDQPISRLPREILRDTLAVVDQNIALFEGTVMDWRRM